MVFNINGEFNWAWIIQPLTLFVCSLVAIFIRHLLKEMQSLRSDIKAEAKRFEDYVRKEQCSLHRQVIEQHIKESESRIKQVLAHCKKRNEDELG